MFLFCRVSRSALGPTQYPTQKILSYFFPKINRQERETLITATFAEKDREIISRRKSKENNNNPMDSICNVQ
jgi:hypothetical protein